MDTSLLRAAPLRVPVELVEPQTVGSQPWNGMMDSKGGGCLNAYVDSENMSKMQS